MVNDIHPAVVLIDRSHADFHNGFVVSCLLFKASGPLRGRIGGLRFLSWALTALAAAQVAGCGSYRDGVERTERYLAYQERLDEYLAKVHWANESFRMRIPRRFQMVDRDADIKRKIALPPIIAKLDGVETIWRAEFPCRDGTIRTGWLVIVSNRHIWKQGTATLEDSERYAQQTLRQLYQPSGESAPAIENVVAKSIPAEGEFSKSRPFFEFSTAYPRGTAFPTAYTVRIDLHVKDALQVGIVWIIPESIDATRKQSLEKAIGHSLETLDLVGPTTPSAITSR